MKFWLVEIRVFCFIKICKYLSIYLYNLKLKEHFTSSYSRAVEVVSITCQWLKLIISCTFCLLRYLITISRKCKEAAIDLIANSWILSPQVIMNSPSLGSQSDCSICNSLYVRKYYYVLLEYTFCIVKVYFKLHEFQHI